MLWHRPQIIAAVASPLIGCAALANATGAVSMTRASAEAAVFAVGWRQNFHATATMLLIIECIPLGNDGKVVRLLGGALIEVNVCH
jgi:hypothetical protein